MGAVVPRSANARPSYWPPMDMSGNFSVHMSDGGDFVKVPSTNVVGLRSVQQIQAEGTTGEREAVQRKKGFYSDIVQKSEGGQTRIKTL